MDSNNLFFSIFLIIFGLFFYKYVLVIFNKFNLKFLIDEQFNKPQAFHDFPVSTVGGVGIFISLLIIIIIPGAHGNHYHNHHHNPCELPKGRCAVIRWTALPQVYIQ